MANEDKRSMESGTLWTLLNGVPSLQPVLDVQKITGVRTQNVTIVQNDPIIFRVKEKKGKMLRQALTLPFGQRIIRRIRETAN